MEAICEILADRRVFNNMNCRSVMCDVIQLGEGDRNSCYVSGCRVSRRFSCVINNVVIYAAINLPLL